MVMLIIIAVRAAWVWGSLAACLISGVLCKFEMFVSRRLAPHFAWLAWTLQCHLFQTCHVVCIGMPLGLPCTDAIRLEVPGSFPACSLACHELHLGYLVQPTTCNSKCAPLLLLLLFLLVIRRE